MPCGGSLNPGAPKPNAPNPPAPVGGIGRIPRRGPTRIPYGTRSSGLMSQGAPLPKPGYTGYKLPYDLKRQGSHELPTYQPKTISPGRVSPTRPVPNGRRSALSTPNTPTTTQPLHLAGVDRHQYFHERYPREPGIGDALPINGQLQYINDSKIPGGQAQGTRYAYTDVAEKLPMDLKAKTRWRLFEQAVRRARLAVKKPVRLVGRESALDYAKSPRGKPGTPGGIVGAGRQIPAPKTTLRGTMNWNSQAPTDVMAEMAREAVRVNP